MAKKSKPKAKARPTTKRKVEAKVAQKRHERKAKPSEVEMLERGRALATSYLVQRDGMDEETAKIVIDSMAPEDVNELITEANSAVIERTAGAGGGVPAGVAESPVRQAGPAAGGTGGSPERDWSKPADNGYVDFSTIKALAANIDFPELVAECAQLRVEKNRLEAVCKFKVAHLFNVLAAAGAGPGTKVECAGFKMEPYIGTSSQLNKERLLELGVAADIVVKGYKKSNYNDVRIYAPKE